jgi:hypothetical protein
VLVPCLSEKGKLGVYSAKEEEMQKPNVGDIVDIKPISDFEGSEMLGPGRTNLGSDVNPKSFNTDIMNTSIKNNVNTNNLIAVLCNYLPQIYDPLRAPRWASIQAAT